MAEMKNLYPTLVSDKFVETINFYEDFFGFAPLVEQEGYALLQQKDNADMRLAVFDVNHKCVSDRVQPVQGVILSLAVDNVEHLYNELFMEGLEMYKDLGQDVNDRRHFVVYDPNGVLINVSEPLEMVLAA